MASEPCAMRLGRLMLSRGAQPPCEAPLGGALLLIPVGQALSVRQDGVPRILHPPADLLFLPAGERGLHAGGFEGWRLEVEVQDLCQLASELAGHRLSPARVRRRLARGQALQLRRSPGRELCAVLLDLLELGATPCGLQREPLELLELDQVMLRLVTLLLCGDQIHAVRLRPPAEPGHRHRVFEDLLSWIAAHLDQPIQLKDLVRQSGYSQRSLRNFFQERFGCGPMQWIRGERLRCARERLLNPQPQDTVSTIAASLGYGHPSQFSRDVQRAFGSRPSALLREGRRFGGPSGARRDGAPLREPDPPTTATPGGPVFAAPPPATGGAPGGPA